MRRIIVLALLAVGLMAAPASAQYEPQVLAEIVDNVITGSGCPANSTVTFTVFDLDGQHVADLGSTMANASGEFSTPLDFTGIASGEYVLEISCGDVTTTFSLTVTDGTVDGTPGTGTGTGTGTGAGDELARTGSSDMTGLIRIGALLFAAGGLLLLVTRRRSSATV